MPERRAATKTDDTRLVKPAAQPVAPQATPAPPTSVARAVDPAAPQTATPEQLRRLHQRVGNRALNRLLTSGAVQAKLTVGPAGDRYEQEADRAADAVMRTTQTPAPTAEDDAPVQREMLEEDEPLQREMLEEDEPVQREMLEEEEPLQRAPAAPVGLAGGEAGSAIEAKLAANRGAGAPLPNATRAKMEAGLGADFSGVRIHTGSEAANLNQQLGAQAFTHGADVYMGAGKYAPGSSDGQHLLAHELTHVVQQGAGTVRRRARRPAVSPLTETVADGVIHRKLAGTTAAVVDLGGMPSAKSQRKAALSALTAKFGKDKTGEGSGKYAQLIRALEAYEAQEAKYLARAARSLTPREKAALINHLGDMVTLVNAWLQDNAALEADPETAKTKVKKMLPEAIKAEESQDQRRYHALRLLLPRLRHEQMEIAQDQFFETQVWSDATLDPQATPQNPGGSKDDWTGGAVNRLDKVVHQGQQGVFTQDKTWYDALNVGTNLGITVADPNAGARSVAMYQLAQLLDLGVDVIAKTEFATHSSNTNLPKPEGAPEPAKIAKMGVRQAMAPGAEAAKTPAALTAAEAREQGGGKISLEDPVLQRSLNALQLIDAIAGQVDRHWANYYIAKDGQGRVTGVIGIDLDMAFAPDQKTMRLPTDDKADPMNGAHFVGLPHLVDSDFAERIVSVRASDVEALLEAYLKPAEVAATLERFKLVQEACRGVLDRKEAILPDAWGAGTARETLRQGTKSSYLGAMATGVTDDEFKTPVERLTRERIKDSWAVRNIESHIPALAPLVMSRILTVQEGLGLFDAIHGNYLALEVEDAREKLIKDLLATEIYNWNTVLEKPSANPGVLLKVRP